MNLTHLDLFSGIGGFSLAAQWNGIETIQFVEMDKFCQKVLNKNFKGVPIHDDIKTFHSTVRPFLLTGGFPCQPFSCAGKQRGTEDNRYLWPEMLRVISEAKPEWIIGENVRGFISNNNGMVFENCCLDLEREGYSVQAFIIPACAVNAPHRRDRVWIVAHSQCTEWWAFKQRHNQPTGTAIWQPIKNSDSHAPNANGSGSGTPTSGTDGNGTQGSEEQQLSQSEYSGQDSIITIANGSRNGWQEPWLEVATRLCRVDDGLPRQVDRVNRLKALGNAIVPQVAFEIMKSIINIEKESHE